MKKKTTKWESIADWILEAPQTVEGLIIVIPYLLLNAIGTGLKLTFLSLIAVLSLNNWVKLGVLWSKKSWKTNLGNPWNCVLAITCFVFLYIIL